MIFSTYWFIVFATVIIPVYWLLSAKPLFKKIWLVLACVVFHAHFAGAAGVLPIIFIGLVTYFTGLTRNSPLILAGIVVNVLALCFYKYTQFIVVSALGSLNAGLGEYLWAHTQPLLPAAPPLAISFFTFEFVHYLTDVRRGEPPIRRPLDFLLFSIFFPSLVAGPIKRFESFLPALKKGLNTQSALRVCVGFMRVLMGMFKKLVIADNLTMWIDYQMPRLADLDLATRHHLFFGIGFRILMDFSGYSDIAIGIAQMLGIRLPENFNWPYIATNIQDFWHRWHISLSSWIRDYVYIPLGGGRRGKFRTLLNGLIAFALCGLWHGAAWNFAFWGVYHGTGLVLYRLYHELIKTPLAARREHSWQDSLLVTWPLHFFSWLLTQSFVFVGWLFFFYPIGDAIKYLRLMFHK